MSEQAGGVVSEVSRSAPADPTRTPAPGGLDPLVVASWAQQLAALTRTGLDDRSLVDLLRALEVLKCAAEGVQGLAAVELDVSVRMSEQRRGLPGVRQGGGVGGQVALARRESPVKGRRHLELARVLIREMPCAAAAWRAGRISEWRATLLARETACLSREHRGQVDAELAGDPAWIEAMGEGELVASARRVAYRLDPGSVVARRRRARAERRVSLRPAPDVMSHLSALLPVADGVAVYAALERQAAALVAQGDHRGRGQIMVDTLVQRVLGTSSQGFPGHPAKEAHRREDCAGARDAGAHGSGDPGDGSSGADVAVMIHLVVSDAVLLGDGDGAAHVDGYGPVPADLARELAGAEATWLRRLYVRPDTGALVAADARTRRFPPGLARLIRLRDQRCRTSWCDAPIRHTDHVIAVRDGGTTTLENGQGLCEACNYLKSKSAWTARPRPGPRHTVQTTTPTGHRHTSTAPVIGDDPPPGSPEHAVRTVRPDRLGLRVGGAPRARSWTVLEEEFVGEHRTWQAAPPCPAEAPDPGRSNLLVEAPRSVARTSTVGQRGDHGSKRYSSETARTWSVSRPLV